MSRPRLLIAAVALLAATACFGPQPRIVRQELRPPAQAGGPWLLAVTVSNESRGEGQAEITSRLLGQGDAVVGQVSREVDLAPHETVSVVLEIHPAGPGPYRVQSEVKAPPE
jgi:hypothetical protein